MMTTAIPSYKTLTKQISNNLTMLNKDMPDVLKGFYQLSASANKEGALNKKTKELIALAIGVAARCDGCIGFHTKALVELGATKAEIEEMLAVAIYMGGGPSLMYAANTIAAFEEFNQ